MRGSKEQHDLPMYYERLEHSPVLFPDYVDLITVNRDLLTSGSRYDANNPNLITRLVPRHYFLEAQAEEGLEDEDGALHENMATMKTRFFLVVVKYQQRRYSLLSCSFGLHFLMK